MPGLRRARLAAIGLLPLCITTVNAQTSRVRHMQWGGLDRSFIVRVPSGADTLPALPLVIALHGRGGSAASMIRGSGLDAKADAEGFALVAPEGTGDPRGWYTGFSLGAEIDDVGFVGAVIDSIAKHYRIDRRRVYVVGYSNGAVLAHRVAADLPARIAAAAAVAGAIGARGNDGIVRRIDVPRAPVPMMIIHGDVDDIVPYDTVPPRRARPVPAADGARFWARANECSVLEPRRDSTSNAQVVRDTWSSGCRAPVVFVTLRGGGHGWPRTDRGAALNATDAIWEFFRQHSR